ncbi:hypothetical protein LTS10_010183 [Elasticomyces elasticus]|nr:hypothetical protein LTS10_010183 [Elasticomyces elasticus]
MALLQFISAGLPKVAIPTTIHSDHLIVAEHGDETDVRNAKEQHREVYEFLSSASQRYGIGYWKAGSGIIHTIILENYAFPGGLIIGTDSHTPNAGGLGMLGIGVGGSDAVDAMAGMPWELQCPKVIGVCLTGRLQGWASSKDIILKLAGILTVSGGKGKIIEFYGPGVQTLNATAMATVCNMSAEVGSTSCIFPFTDATARYLAATDRSFIADAARQNSNLVIADEGSEQHYDDVIHIDLDTLEPHINGPFTPDLSHPLSRFSADISQSSWPQQLSQAMVGSCTNSSYEDLKKVVNLVREAEAVGLKPKVPMLITAGSEKIQATVAREGILRELEAAGATVLRRHDGNPATHSFVTSPEIVTAFAYSGDLNFNPTCDTLTTPNGQPFRFSLPHAEELPISFAKGDTHYQAPPKDGSSVEVVVSPTSDRLQLLQPFAAWKQGNADDMTVLVKVRGKCTTDHISPAGPWYNFRGHLENISNNLLTAAENDFLASSPRVSRGHALDQVAGTVESIPQVAKNYKKAGIRWCILGDTNYGEGSSREHAALEPRFLGGVAVIARSFARIHETNLKKQGMLALTFSDANVYNDIEADDRISVSGVEDMKPGVRLKMRVKKRDGKVWESWLDHSYQAGQIPWLMSGSALNYVKSQRLRQDV